MCLLLFLKIIEILLLLSYKLRINKVLIKGSWYGVVVCNERVCLCFLEEESRPEKLLLDCYKLYKGKLPIF